MLEQVDLLIYFFSDCKLTKDLNTFKKSQTQTLFAMIIKRNSRCYFN